MRAITHIAASGAAAAAVAAAADPCAGAAVLLFGGFIDADHVQHFVSSGLPLNPGALLRSVFSSEGQLEKKYGISRKVPDNVLFPVLHNVELALALLFSSIVLDSVFLAGAFAGMILHLLMDIKSYPCSPLFFSMGWRLSNRRKLLKAWKTHRSSIKW